MKSIIGSWRGFVRAAAGLGLAGLAAACASGPPQPAPVYYGTAGRPPSWEPSPPITRPYAYEPARRAPLAPLPPRSPGSPPPLASTPPPSGSPLQITVEHGDSLGRLAERYHTTQHAIIEANGLKPPFKILAGSRLTIPGSGAPPSEHVAGGPPQALAPPGPSAASGRPPEIIPLDAPAPGSPPPGAAGPPPLTPPGTLPPQQAAAPLPPSGELSVADEARAEEARGRPPAAGEPTTHGGRFPWPVRGKIVAGFGAGPNGSRNDGINIAAPRGTPIRAIEGGEVAYAGNELRGYGNLVLVKHSDGWISAYAHCEELLVKKGDRVRPGQIIAKVGSTGSVSAPQLHFELRRGKRPVDPRQFLAPAPSAGASGPAAG